LSGIFLRYRANTRKIIHLLGNGVQEIAIFDYDIICCNFSNPVSDSTNVSLAVSQTSHVFDVTTTDILRGLGLAGPDPRGWTPLEDLRTSASWENRAFKI
jgi:hypothetical protein